jgi:hypothetical protein
MRDKNLRVPLHVPLSGTLRLIRPVRAEEELLHVIGTLDALLDPLHCATQNTFLLDGSERLGVSDNDEGLVGPNVFGRHLGRVQDPRVSEMGQNELRLVGVHGKVADHKRVRVPDLDGARADVATVADGYTLNPIGSVPPLDINNLGTETGTQRTDETRVVCPCNPRPCLTSKPFGFLACPGS